MRLFAFVASVALLLAVTTAAQESGAPPSADHTRARTVWDGVFSLAQAERGAKAYDAHCAGCHRFDLSGYDGLLHGPRFMEKYREASLGLLFEKTRTTMPRNAAGTLSEQMYADIISYVLDVNDFPAGDAELVAADIPRIRLVGKSGPEPVPNFSLVQVFGCLSARGDGWQLTGTTEPVRTGQPRPTPEDPSVSKAAAPGTANFGLMVSASYAPANYAGNAVEVRGFLMRGATDSRINVTSLERVGASCAP